MTTASDAAPAASPAEVQEAFFRATFQSWATSPRPTAASPSTRSRGARDHERAAARRARSAARHRLFTQGKRRDLPLRAAAARAAAAVPQAPDLCRIFLEIQVRAALWGGNLQGRQRATCWRAVCAALGISRLELAHIEAVLRMQQRFASAGGAARGRRVAEAYEVLGWCRARRQTTRSEGLSPPAEPASSGQAQSQRPAGVHAGARQREARSQIIEAYELMNERARHVMQPAR